MIEPLPCPCCGNTELYVGAHSSDSQEVLCQDLYNFAHDAVGNHLIRMGKVTAEDLEGPEFQGCGLRMIVNVPDEIPKPLRGLPVDKMLKKLREMTLEEAVRRWNRRVKQLNS